MSTPTALITGAAQRVGATISRTLHDAGFNIAIHYRHSGDAAQALATELTKRRPRSAIALQADLNDPAVHQVLIDDACRHFGGIDALINNASSFYPTPLGETTLEQWHDLMASNLQAPFFLAQAAAKPLRERKGCIVNITDIHAERPLTGFPVYSAAKGGLLTLTRALAIELAPAIRVNAVAPGAIAWPTNGSFDEEECRAIIDHTLLKRIGCPEDIARTVRFLIMDAPYITGEVINVDGGRSAHL